MALQAVCGNFSEIMKQTAIPILERSLSFKEWKSEDPVVEDSKDFSKPVSGKSVHQIDGNKLTISLPEPVFLFPSTPPSQLYAAATTLQKVYKSYRTRRNLADCAIVVEELWWKALDFAALKRNSISFFDVKKPETAISRWARTMRRVAKVGKGLLKDEKAQKLALRHWLEAIDPRHRYGHNLHLYYDVWSESRSSQPFFYWLDVGDGKEVNLKTCPRSVLQRQCIKYLGPKEREAYEVIVEEGRLIYKISGVLLSTTDCSKWIFVLSTSRLLYVGQKKKGSFQHSSFLSGAATTAAGRLVASEGMLKAIWPYSGHYLPTEENFKEFIIFLEHNELDLTNVKKCAVDDDYNSSVPSSEDSVQICSRHAQNGNANTPRKKMSEVSDPIFGTSNRLSCKWSSGLGPRIGCVRDYPLELQTKALEEVNLSPRVTPGHTPVRAPIRSPRPSPKILVSPRLSYMGLPSPRAS